MSTYLFFLKMDLKKLKNHIKDIFKSPSKLIAYGFYIAFWGFIIFGLVSGNETSAEVPNIELKRGIFVAIINTLIILFFGFNIYSGTKEMSNFFNIADVNFLFPSPISPKKILSYHMIKNSLLAGLLSIIFLFWLPAIQNALGQLHLIEIIYSFVGIVVLCIFSVPFTFLSFILSSRFGFKRWLQFFLYGLIVLVVVGILYGVYREQDFFSGLLWVLNHPWFSYIPIIGWSSELIGVIAFGVNTYTNIFFVLQVLTIGTVYFFAVYLAEDYYEDAVPAAEKVAALLKQAKKNNNTPILLSKLKEGRSVKVKKIGEGPWAFLWMQLVIVKRASGSLLFQWKHLVFIIISILFGILVPDKSTSSFYILSGGIAYMLFIFSIAISIDNELKQKYVFILPGKPWEKIIALNTVPILKVLIGISCALIPAAIILKVPVYAFLAGLLFPASMIALNLFTTVIIHVLIPSKFDQKAFYPIIRVFSFMIFLIPPAVAGVLLGAYTENTAIGFLSVSLINIVFSGICLGFTDRAFRRLEIR